MDETGSMTSDGGSEDPIGDAGSWTPAFARNVCLFLLFIAGTGLALELPRLLPQLWTQAPGVLHPSTSPIGAAEAAPVARDGSVRAADPFTPAGSGLGAPGGQPGLRLASEQPLEMQYLSCARDSSRQRMDAGEAAACSQVADVLLASSFAGDFNRMIDWWQAHRLAE